MESNDPSLELSSAVIAVAIIPVSLYDWFDKEVFSITVTALAVPERRVRPGAEKGRCWKLV
jgi:hypothetical protein